MLCEHFQASALTCDLCSTCQAHQLLHSAAYMPVGAPDYTAGSAKQSGNVSHI